MLSGTVAERDFRKLYLRGDETAGRSARGRLAGVAKVSRTLVWDWAVEGLGLGLTAVQLRGLAVHSNNSMYDNPGGVFFHCNLKLP